MRLRDLKGAGIRVRAARPAERIDGKAGHFRGGSLVTHGRDEKIRSKDSYGGDPLPPRFRPPSVNCPGRRTKAATQADSSPTQVDSFSANVAVHRHECCPVVGKRSLSLAASRPADSIDRLFRRNKLKTVTFGAFRSSSKTIWPGSISVCLAR
jgi:hypothetical protein